MKILPVSAGLFVLALAVQGCAPQRTTNADMNCTGATVAGAVVGGVIGNQIGSGTGRTLATIAGTGAGAAVGANAACQ